MPKPQGPSRQEAIEQVLRKVDRPLTFDELLAGVQRLVSVDAKKLKAAMGASYTRPPCVQRTADGRYVWLPIMLSGVTVRHVLQADELRNQLLKLDLMLDTALWPETSWADVQPDSPPWTVRLPNDIAVTLRPAVVQDRQWRMVHGLSVDPAFWTWLERAGAQPGDSLFLTVTDTERHECHLAFEPAAQRAEARIAERNRAVADAAYHFLQGRRRRVWLAEMAPGLLALGAYHDPYPPAPLQTALRSDERFLWESSDAVQIANRYDQLHRALHIEPDYWEMQELFEQHPLGKGEPEEPGEEQPRELRRPLEDLAGEVYRFKATFRYRPDLWRRIEIRGDQDLYEFDDVMRSAFGHDWDHLSEFYLGTDAEHHRRGLGNMSTFGEYAEAVDYLIGELGLRPGDELSYTYDFGDNIQHVLKLEAIEPSDPDAEYPRVAEQNKPHYQYCERCQARGKQEIATWRCIWCSNEQQHEVLICKKCARAAHGEHYAEEIAY